MKVCMLFFSVKCSQQNCYGRIELILSIHFPVHLKLDVRNLY